MVKVLINEDRCKGCELCVSVCPQRIIGFKSNLNIKGYKPVTVTEKDKCLGCGLCALMCPDVAIEIYK
ncbi:MAG TPA: 4Fe-4S binding protein [Clostridia bacterium]|jgi:2-oxoglutarate ferredoxin oxidoreductase subunit delta|nr:4Fe-4S binding protein [Clostridia bacterium]